MVGCLGIRALPEPGGKRVGIWMCSPLSAGTELQKDLGQIHEMCGITFLVVGSGQCAGAQQDK